MKDNTNIKPVKAKSVKKNYIYNLLYKLFLVVVPLVLTPYVSRVLTPTGNGKYVFSFSLISYFTLIASLGFRYYSQRTIAKIHDNKYKQSKAFYEIMSFKTVTTSIALFAYLIFLFSGVFAEYQTIMSILTINIVVIFLDTTFLLQGNEDFGKIVLRNFFVQLFGIIAIMSIVKGPEDLWKYTLINSLMLLIANLSMLPFAKKYLVKVPISELNIKKHVIPCFKLFIPAVAMTIYTVLDKTLIGLITDDDAQNGVYDAAMKFIKMGITIFSSLGAVMIPRNSRELAKGNSEGVKNNIYTVSNFIWLLGIPMVLGLAVTARNIVPWFYGPGYEGVIPLMQILAPLFIIEGFSNLFGPQYLIPKQEDNKFTIAIIAGSVINLVLNLSLIWTYKARGAAIGTLFAETTITLIMAFMIRKDLDFKVILRQTPKYIFGGLLMFITCFILRDVFSTDILGTAIVILIGASTYFLILILLRDEFLLSSIKRIINIISNFTHKFKKQSK